MPSGEADTVFPSGGLEQALRSPATEDAFEVLARLVRRFEGRVWVISKCGERVQQRTLAWLDYHNFCAETGISRDNVRFCRRRADKAVICAELGITHMIDDRLDVHQALRDLVPYLYLFGRQSEPAPAWVRHTPTWSDVEAAITADTAEGFARLVDQRILLDMVNDDARDRALYHALKAVDEVAAALQTHLIEEHAASAERPTADGVSSNSLSLLRQARERLGEGLRAIEADRIADSDQISLRGDH